MVTEAVLAALVAFAVAAALTPLAMRFSRWIGAVDQQKETGLATAPIPLLGGLAIFGGALVSGLFFLPDNSRTEGILAAAVLITIVGFLDDRFELSPILKLLGQIAAAVVLVTNDVVVDAFTFPFLHRVELGGFGGGQVLGHQHAARRGAAVRDAQQLAQHGVAHGGDVRGSRPQVGVGHVGEIARDRVDGRGPGGGGGLTAVHPGVDVAEEVGVVEQQEVGVEDGRLGLADVAGGTGAHLRHAAPDGRDRLGEPAPLDGRVTRLDPGEVDRCEPRRPRRADAHAG